MACASCADAPVEGTADQKTDLVDNTMAFLESVSVSGVPSADDAIWLDAGRIPQAEIDALQEYLVSFGEFSSLSEASCNEEFVFSTSRISKDTVCRSMSTHADGSKLEHSVKWQTTDNKALVASYYLTVYGPPILSIPTKKE